MSFDVGRDVVNRPDKIERHLAVIVDVLRELMGKAPPEPGWLATIPAEEYRRKFRSRRTSDDSGASNLPPSGGVPPEEFFSRRER